MEMAVRKGSFFSFFLLIFKIYRVIISVSSITVFWRLLPRTLFGKRKFFVKRGICAAH